MSERFHFCKGAGSLFSQLLSDGKISEHHGFCTRGACGRCRVRFVTGAPLPSAADRRVFTAGELRQGYRLACTAKPEADCELELHFVQETECAIVTEAYLPETADVQKPLAEETGVQKPLAEETGGQSPLPEKWQGELFCAVDVGTTTVVMQLLEKAEGRVLMTRAFQNPQRRYGTDVLARLTAAESGSGTALRAVLLTELENGIRQMQENLQKHGNYDKSWAVVLSGNTVMEHLLLGYPVKGLGKAPFHRHHSGFSCFDLCGHQAIFLPGISAFVGGDIVAGIYACHMAEREEMSLLVDLGTNGEMAVGNRNGILCTATAAGPAFEGGVSADIPGTDMTALASDMLKAGIMDETGLLGEPWFEQGWQHGKLLLRQQDIRSLQMAKAAVCAGISILLEAAGAKDRVAHIYLAGGFGYHLDADKAVSIGLLPAYLKNRCRAAGNTSLAGAVRYGRNLPGAAAALKHITDISRCINLAQQPEFERTYISDMAFREL